MSKRKRCLAWNKQKKCICEPIFNDGLLVDRKCPIHGDKLKWKN